MVKGVIEAPEGRRFLGNIGLCILDSDRIFQLTLHINSPTEWTPWWCIIYSLPEDCLSPIDVSKRFQAKTETHDSDSMIFDQQGFSSRPSSFSSVVSCPSTHRIGPLDEEWFDTLRLARLIIAVIMLGRTICYQSDTNNFWQAFQQPGALFSNIPTTWSHPTGSQNQSRV